MAPITDFPFNIDPVVQSAIVQDPGLEKLAEDILERIRTREAGFSESLSRRVSLLHLRVRDSLPDRIRYLVRLFTMPTVKEWTLYPLPPRLTPLYRIIRPIRLGVRLALLSLLGGKVSRNNKTTNNHD
ncbi:MAG: hypothetical protein LC660_05880 [Desulfobacteraceae bacterium]|nr:hypothetical protein [Desulfobacteraceae bacterium]